jgi:hypothetical protein
MAVLFSIVKTKVEIAPSSQTKVLLEKSDTAI